MVARSDALEAEFYNRDTIAVARDLLGTLIVRASEAGPRIARIVETEAYLPDDPASHAYRGPTERNGVMFGPPGHAYVYLIYGMHHCLNTVTEPRGTGAAVLIRAAEPLFGVEAMWQARFPDASAPPGIGDGRPEPRLVARLTNGPGKLCQALDIRRERENGAALNGGNLQIAEYVELDGVPGTVLTAPPTLEIIEDARIGITRAADEPWRFTVAGSRFVSRMPDPAIRPRNHRRR